MINLKTGDVIKTIYGETTAILNLNEDLYGLSELNNKVIQYYVTPESLFGIVGF